MTDGPGRSTSPRRWRELLDVLVQVAFVIAAGTLVYATLIRPTRPPLDPGRSQPARPEPPLPTAPVSLEGAAIKGNKGATVALIEYSDFECPFCGKFARETLPTLDEKYIRPGKLLMAFRHLPLPIHASAQKAAEAAECAGQQGQFWRMHDILFEDPRQLGEAQLRQRAADLGLNRNQFDACLAGDVIRKVNADVESSRALAITGTPTFLLGRIQPDGRVKVTRRLSGAQPTAVFEAALDALLTASSGTSSK